MLLFLNHSNNNILQWFRASSIRLSRLLLFFTFVWLWTWCHSAFQSPSFINIRSLRYITCRAMWPWCPPCRRSWWHVLPTSGCMYTSGTAWAWSPSCSPSISTISPSPTCSTTSPWLAASRMTNNKKSWSNSKDLHVLYVLQDFHFQTRFP